MTIQRSSDETYHDWLRTDILKRDLRRRTVRGGLSSFIGGNISFVLRTLFGIVLARLLLPEHFGVIGMVTAVTVFADAFKDLGLDAATIQAKEVSHEQISTLFWVNSALGALLMILVSALSPALAWFYKDQRLILITLSLSVNYFFNGIIIQHLALLKRQMMFARIAIIDISSVIISMTVAIVLARRGFGYWSLIAGQLASGLSYVLLTYCLCRWVPGLPSRGNGVRSMLLFGRNMTTSNIVSFLTKSLNLMLLGKFWGPTSVGLYSQAQKLILMPIEQTGIPLTNTAISALSALQTERQRYREYCMKVVELYAFVNIAISAYLAIFAEPIIRLLLGENWLELIPIFRVFAVTTLVRCLQFPCGFIMVTSGRTDKLVWYSVFQCLLTISGFIAGLHWGALGVAIGYSVSVYVFILPGLFLSVRGTPVKVSDLFHSVVSPAGGSIAVAGALLLYERFVTNTNDILYLLYSTILAILVYCLFWLLIPGGKKRLKTYLSYLSALKSR
jgi:O-antigen/teichoic acid export membrane protein